jgi:hypothetical protein
MKSFCTSLTGASLLLLIASPTLALEVRSPAPEGDKGTLEARYVGNTCRPAPGFYCLATATKRDTAPAFVEVRSPAPEEEKSMLEARYVGNTCKPRPGIACLATVGISFPRKTAASASGFFRS